MAKIVLDTVTGGYDLSVINNNFDKIETELQNNVLYRNNPVGEPNTLETDVDINSKRLYNLPEPLLDNQAARLQDVQNAIAGGAANLIQFTPYGHVSSNNIQAAMQELIDDTTNNGIALPTFLKDSNTIVVDNIVSLKALDKTKFTKAHVLGYYTKGDGGGGIYWFDSSDTTSTDNGGTLIVATDNGRWKLTHVGSVSVRQFGAKGDGATNDTVAIQNAVNSVNDIVIPSGTYRIIDKIDIPSGKRVRGLGKHKTIIHIGSDFNLAATGVLVLQQNAEPGALIEDLSLIFIQPDTAIRASLIQYPSAIRAVDVPRFSIRRVRIELAWNGINMTGNSGGAVIDDLEISAFNTDIDIDGSLDSIKISKLHVWPFGLTTRSLLYSLYESNLHTGIKSGRCDDFHLSDSIFFSLAIATNFYQSALGSTFGNITGVDFDDRGGLNVSAGSLTINGCYFTLGKTDAVISNITGGSVAFDGCIASMIAVPNGGTAVIVTGVDTQITWDGGLVGMGSLDATFISGGDNCRLNVVGPQINRDPNIAYTKPTIYYANARGVCVGVTTNDIGSGSGKLVVVDTDTRVRIADCQEGGWGYQFPAGAVSNIRFSGRGVVGIATSTGTPDGSGNLTFNHNLPIRPLLVLPTAIGSGGFVHIQFVSANDTQITLNIRDAAGGPITTAISFGWCAFL